MKMERPVIRTAMPPDWVVRDEATLRLLKSEPGRVRLALTGNIASGKSTLAALLAAFGAETIDFDLLARQAVAPGSPGLAAAADLLGRKCLAPDGTLDRPKVSRLMHKKPGLRAALEALIHPITWALMAEELKAKAEAGLLVISVPLLFEAGLETFFSPIALAFVDYNTQLTRLMARDPKLWRWQARRQIANQWPAASKLTRCDYIVDNGLSISHTIGQAKGLWLRLNSPSWPA